MMVVLGNKDVYRGISLENESKTSGMVFKFIVYVII